MSEPTPDDLRRKALLDSIPLQAARASAPKNPFLIALIVVTVVLAVITGVIYAVGISSYDPLLKNQLFPVANTWAILGLVTLLVTLIVGGLTWKPAPAAKDSDSQ
ncbi:MAG: hypothetical protein ABIP33_00705 [Pseudolysinimonas sp.]